MYINIHNNYIIEYELFARKKINIDNKILTREEALIKFSTMLDKLLNEENLNLRDLCLALLGRPQNTYTAEKYPDEFKIFSNLAKNNRSKFGSYLFGKNITRSSVDMLAMLFIKAVDTKYAFDKNKQFNKEIFFKFLDLNEIKYNKNDFTENYFKEILFHNTIQFNNINKKINLSTTNNIKAVIKILSCYKFSKDNSFIYKNQFESNNSNPYIVNKIKDSINEIIFISNMTEEEKKSSIIEILEMKVRLVSATQQNNSGNSTSESSNLSSQKENYSKDIKLKLDKLSSQNIRNSQLLYNLISDKYGKEFKNIQFEDNDIKFVIDIAGEGTHEYNILKVSSNNDNYIIINIDNGPNLFNIIEENGIIDKDQLNILLQNLHDLKDEYKLGRQQHPCSCSVKALRSSLILNYYYNKNCQYNKDQLNALKSDTDFILYLFDTNIYDENYQTIIDNEITKLWINASEEIDIDTLKENVNSYILNEKNFTNDAKDLLKKYIAKQLKNKIEYKEIINALMDVIANIEDKDYLNSVKQKDIVKILFNINKVDDNTFSITPTCNIKTENDFIKAKTSFIQAVKKHAENLKDVKK